MKGRENNMSYYLSKYKGQYRLLAPYDLQTNDFPREPDGSLCTSDVYIKCTNKCQIFYYGKGILEFYCPSLGRGRNIIRAIKADGLIDNILSVRESDEEVIIQFYDKNFSKLVSYFQPLTSGASISPFSIKNLPKTKYTIPEEDLQKYNAIVEPSGLSYLALGHLCKEFINSLATKKRPKEVIVADMRQRGLKGKDYIHSVGLWDKYLKFVTKKVGELP